jgi:hypothetical protein
MSATALSKSTDGASGTILSVKPKSAFEYLRQWCMGGDRRQTLQSATDFCKEVSQAADVIEERIENIQVNTVVPAVAEGIIEKVATVTNSLKEGMPSVHSLRNVNVVDACHDVRSFVQTSAQNAVGIGSEAVRAFGDRAPDIIEKSIWFIEDAKGVGTTCSEKVIEDVTRICNKIDVKTLTEVLSGGAGMDKLISTSIRLGIYTRLLYADTSGFLASKLGNLDCRDYLLRTWTGLNSCSRVLERDVTNIVRQFDLIYLAAGLGKLVWRTLLISLIIFGRVAKFTGKVTYRLVCGGRVATV